MDFSNRNVQSQAATPSAQAPAAGSPTNNRRNKIDGGKWGRIGVFALVLAVVILLVAIISLAAFGNNNKTEDQYVDSTKLQAVFLNTGQVYFGHITTLNNKYFVVTNIYYLQTSGGSSATGAATANTSVSLVKLGCELHEPYDKMIINSSQVTFWENLQDGGQVAKAVATFQKQNPNGQKCADQSSSSSSTSNAVQSAGSNSTTPATKP
jgi:hypothetical protein